jgi:hypothetical protein
MVWIEGPGAGGSVGHHGGAADGCRAVAGQRSHAGRHAGTVEGGPGPRGFARRIRIPDVPGWRTSPHFRGIMAATIRSDHRAASPLAHPGHAQAADTACRTICFHAGRNHARYNGSPGSDHGNPVSRWRSAMDALPPPHCFYRGTTLAFSPLPSTRTCIAFRRRASTGCVIVRRPPVAMSSTTRCASFFTTLLSA